MRIILSILLLSVCYPQNNWIPDYIVTETGESGDMITIDENDWIIPEDADSTLVMGNYVATYSISAPYPNPADGVTSINISLFSEIHTQLYIYNAFGDTTIILNELLSLGSYSYTIGLDDGFYRCVFDAGNTHIEGDIQFGELIYGCTDPEACNYDETANADDGSCNIDIYNG